MNKNVAAVVLAYRSEDEILLNIEVTLKQVDRVFLVVNEISTIPENILAKVRTNSKITAIENINNVGVAEGFNQGLAAALANGYEYVIIFDQDSRPTEGMVSGLVQVAEREHDFFGLVGPALRDKKSNRLSKKEQGGGVEQTSILISSGTVFPRRTIEKVGYYDRNLFIDYVDHEYCLRVSKLGGTLLKSYNFLLDHQFGNSDVKSFFGRPFFAADYSPLRHYYMGRNRILVLKKHGFGPWFTEDVGYFIKGLVKIIFYEDRKWAKLRSIIKGSWHGLKQKV